MSDTIHRRIAARAREIISDPDHWTARELAIGHTGTPVDPTDREAERYCAVGALIRAASEFAGKEWEAELLAYHTHLGILEFACFPEGQTTLEVINDRQGREAVLKLFDAYLTTH